MAIRKKYLFIMVCLLFFSMFGLLDQTVFAASGEESVERAKNGIVEVQSGFTDAGGKFWRMQYGSGFLINNEEGNTYIITNSHIVENDAEVRNAYCKKHNISVEAGNISNCVRVIVKGDITVTAEILVKSEEKDFCILSTENVISEKETLRLEDSRPVMAGDPIFSMGFENPHGSMEYGADEVQVLQGTVKDAAVSRENEDYIQHTAAVTKGSTGGPVLNEDGYVVGVNCYSVSEDGDNGNYALPINEVQEVLDNFSVSYESSARDEICEKLEALNKECHELYDKGGYTAKTLEALAEAMQKVDKLNDMERADIEELTAAYRSLATARVSLIHKTKTSQVFAYILAVIDVLVLIHVIVLFSWNRKKNLHKEGAGQAGNIKKSFKHTEKPNGRRQMQEQIPVNQNPAYVHRDGNTSMAGVQRSVMQTNSSRISAPRTQGIYLERQKNGQTVMISKDNFVLGKSEEGTDYCIRDNKAVSRKHAVIAKRNDGYYITDLGSSNGTKVNGHSVHKENWVPLNREDTIVLADEEFKIR